jgi:three-Cys-motif partner protein
MDKIYRNGYDFYFWPYEQQTKIKHFVFQDYFDHWVTIVGKWNDLNYFDCHAGSGAYLEGDKIYWGSPVLAAETIEKKEADLDRSVNLVLIEEDDEDIENIKRVFLHRKLKTCPLFIRGDFDLSVNRILDNLQGKLKPTFFFVDPFGFKINISTLHRIMQIPQSEILLNFMFTQVNRFLIDDLEDALNGLFGCPDWKEVREMHGEARERGIIDLYRKQLKKSANFVYPYRISFPDKDRTYYYLFHLTNHVKGCKIMKSSFAKFNYGNVEFSGPKHGVLSLFDNDAFKTEEIGKFLLSRYSGMKKTYDDLLSDLIDETPYLEKQIRAALMDMEKKGLLKISRMPVCTETGRKRTAIADKDMLYFEVTA